MTAYDEVVRTFRRGLSLRPGPVLEDEVVLHGGGEVFRLPLTPGALDRQAVLLRALPVLAVSLPVAVPRPRRIGVLPDGITPFTAEPRLPGVAVAEARGLAALQWDGVAAALDAVPPGQVREWGGLPQPAVLLHDPVRGVLTGLVAWQLSP